MSGKHGGARKFVRKKNVDHGDRHGLIFPLDPKTAEIIGPAKFEYPRRIRNRKNKGNEE